MAAIALVFVFVQLPFIADCIACVVAADQLRVFYGLIVTDFIADYRTDKHNHDNEPKSILFLKLQHF